MSSRNTVLLLMVAVVALLIGVTLKAAVNSSGSSAKNSAAASNEIDSKALLSARLISGDTSATVGEQLGELTLVNFWASWCAPCRNEMPLFEAVYRANKSRGFQLIGIAIDSPEKAQAMLDSMDISYPILYAEMSGMRVMESAGNPQGFLPYSLLLDANGKVLDRTLGEIHEPQIQAWLNDHL